MFDPGDFNGRLRACPLLGAWRALLCEEVLVFERLVAIWSVILQKEVLGILLSRVRYNQLVRIEVNRWFSVARLIRGTVKVRRHEAI